MPVFRTPDGRIVEEKTGVSPPEDGGSDDGRTANGGVSGRDERTAMRTGGGAASAGGRRRTGYADPTVVRRTSAATDEQKSAGRAAGSGDERTRLAGAIPGGTSGAEEIDAVAGWLVIVEGPGKGRDLRVGVGRNTLGRDQGNRIALPFGDTRISRTAHLWINYDHLSRAFSVTPGNSSNLAHLNGTAVEERMPLADGAMIMIGRTALRFVAFCDDRFDWSDAG